MAKQCKTTIFGQHKCLALFSTSSYFGLLLSQQFDTVNVSEIPLPSRHSCNLPIWSRWFPSSADQIGDAAEQTRNSQRAPGQGGVQPWTFDGSLVMVEMPSRDISVTKCRVGPDGAAASFFATSDPKGLRNGYSGTAWSVNVHVDFLDNLMTCSNKGWKLVSRLQHTSACESSWVGEGCITAPCIFHL